MIDAELHKTQLIIVVLLQQVFLPLPYGNNRIYCTCYHIVHPNIALFSIPII